ncbi:MAG: IS110 family transposase [Ignavibacteriaceae bacterium]
MQKKNKELDFSNQIISVGIDVHKKSWTVTIQVAGIQVKNFSMDPSPDQLSKHLHDNYPGGLYQSVYEAGFCGYWIDRQLQALGIRNIIVNPSDVPTSNKEKTRKTDSIDSRKLARELSGENLKGIYIPSEQEEATHDHLKQAYCSLCQTISPRNICFSIYSLFRHSVALLFFLYDFLLMCRTAGAFP